MTNVFPKLRASPLPSRFHASSDVKPPPKFPFQLKQIKPIL